MAKAIASLKEAAKRTTSKFKDVIRTKTTVIKSLQTRNGKKFDSMETGGGFKFFQVNNANTVRKSTGDAVTSKSTLLPPLGPPPNYY